MMQSDEAPPDQGELQEVPFLSEEVIQHVTETSAPELLQEIFQVEPPHEIEANANDFFSNPGETHHIINERNAHLFADELFRSKSASRDVYDSPARGSRYFFPSPNENQSKESYQHGDILWAQVDAHFPWWPAIVVDIAKLPTSVQKTLQPFRKDTTPKRKQKIPIYYYGRDDYDLITVSGLKDFPQFLEEYRQQEVDGSLQSAFLIGLNLAEEELRRPIEERISWVLSPVDCPPIEERPSVEDGGLLSPEGIAVAPAAEDFFAAAPGAAETAVALVEVAEERTNDDEAPAAGEGLEEKKRSFSRSTLSISVDSAPSSQLGTPAITPAPPSEEKPVDPPAPAPGHNLFALSPPAAPEEVVKHPSPFTLSAPPTSRPPMSTASPFDSLPPAHDPFAQQAPAPAPAPVAVAPVIAGPGPFDGPAVSSGSPFDVPAPSVSSTTAVRPTRVAVSAGPFDSAAPAAGDPFGSAPPADSSKVFRKTGALPSASGLFDGPAASQDDPFARSAASSSQSRGLFDLPPPAVGAPRAVTTAAGPFDALPAQTGGPDPFAAPPTAGNMPGPFPLPAPPATLAQPTSRPPVLTASPFDSLPPAHDPFAQQAPAPAPAPVAVAPVIAGPGPFDGPAVSSGSPFDVPAPSVSSTTAVRPTRVAVSAGPFDSAAPAAGDPFRSAPPIANKPPSLAEPSAGRDSLPVSPTPSADSRGSSSAAPKTFKGRAHVVAGPSPFDPSPAVGGPASLFPELAVDPFAQLPSNIPPARRAGDAANVFQSPPKVLPAAAAPPPGPAADSFFQQAPPAPPAIARQTSAGKAAVSAADIFSSGPPQLPSAFDANHPPTAPGVRLPPPSAPQVVPAPVAQPQESKIPVATSRAKTAAKPKAHLLAHPNAIPTPHGFVSPPPSQMAAPEVAKPAASQTAPVPPLARQKAPLVHPATLTSLVSVTAEPVPPPEPVAVEEPPQAVRSPPESVRTAPAFVFRGRYIKPAGPVTAFGFGGHFLLMRPDVNICPPTYSSVGQLTDDRRLRILSIGLRPSPLRIWRLIDLVATQLPAYEFVPGLPEMVAFKRLLTAFPVAEDGRLRDPTESLGLLADQPVTAAFPAAFVERHFQQTAAETVEAEKLLWALLRLAVKFEGQLSSSEAEKEVVALLLGQAPDADPAAALAVRLAALHQEQPNPLLRPAPAPEQRQQQLVAVESLLLLGRRDEALTQAVERQDWPTALMLASLAGPERYQETVRLYSQSLFAASSPMHLLAMVYSNQAVRTLFSAAARSGPKFISQTAQGGPTVSRVAEEAGLFRHWRLTLAALLANKTAEWERSTQLLGYRLQSDFKNILAAHVSFLCAGCLPVDPREVAAVEPFALTAENVAEADFLSLRDFPLVGSSAAWRQSRSMADCLSLAALRMSELLELGLDRAVRGGDRDKSAPSSSGGGGGGLFGFFGSSSGKASAPASGSGDKKTNPSTNPSGPSPQLQERLLRLRMLLGPFKLRLALQLADMGLLAEAAAYVTGALSLVREVNAIEDPKNKKPRPALLPFAKKFLAALDELADRLGIKPLGLVDAPQTNQTAPPKAGGWGLAAVLSTANLTSFVDGPAPEAAKAAAPPETAGLFAPGQPQHAAHPAHRSMAPPVVQHAQPRGPPVSHHPAAPPRSTSLAPGRSAPHSAHPHRTAGSSAFPPQAPGVAPHPFPTPAAAPAPTPAQPTQFPHEPPGPGPQGSAFVEVDLADQHGHHPGHPPTAHPPYTSHPTHAPAHKPQTTAPPASQVKRWQPNPHPAGPSAPVPGKPVASPWALNAAATNMAPQQSQQPAANHANPNPGHGNPNHAHAHAQPQQPAHGHGPPASERQAAAPPALNVAAPVATNAPKADSPANPNKPKPAANAANTLSAPTTGLVGTVRKGILNWLYPDAHDASENIGQSLEAYYDDKLGRWVFPGEDNTVADAALKPPPTGPLGPAPAAAAPMPAHSAGPPTAGQSSAPDGGGYDPLAALMAPPPRLVRQSSAPPGPGADGDPIAAMMAPPRISALNGPPGAVSTPPVSQAGGPPLGAPAPVSNAGAPPAAAAPPTGKFNIWKPKAAENATFATNPDTHQLMNSFQAAVVPAPVPEPVAQPSDQPPQDSLVQEPAPQAAPPVDIYDALDSFN